MHRWTDAQTDMTKLTVAFCNFANVPKKMNASVSTSIFFFKLSHRYESIAKFVTSLRLPEP